MQMKRACTSEWSDKVYVCVYTHKSVLKSKELGPDINTLEPIEMETSSNISQYIKHDELFMLHFCKCRTDKPVLVL